MNPQIKIVKALISAALACAVLALPYPAGAATVATQVTPSLIVMPDRDAAGLVRIIDSAKSSIDIVTRELTDPKVIDTLKAATKRGIKLRVMLEKYPGGAGKKSSGDGRLKEAGAFLNWGNPEFKHTWQNTIVIDRSAAYVSTADFTEESIGKSRGFIVRLLDPREVSEIAEIFEADWNRRKARPRRGALAWAPDLFRSAVFDIINGAHHTISIYTESLMDDHMVRLIGKAIDRGVIVRTITSGRRYAESSPWITRLKALGGRVRKMDTPPLAANMILVDVGHEGARALIGSIDLTPDAMDKARGLAAEINDPERLDRLATIFKDDYSGAGEK